MTGDGVDTGPSLSLGAVVLDCPDARRLAGFYVSLLGWRVVDDEPDWVRIAGVAERPGLSFASDPSYVAPTWPEAAGEQQTMLHLDLLVDGTGEPDLERAVRRAVELGARVADHQPQQGVRVCLDPAGHPFCLFLPGS